MMLTRRTFFASGAGAALAQGSRRPNVLVILADDQGWGDLSIHGNSNLATPNIDSLGKNGALFERFYVCPVCAPTRAEFLTGRYHPRGGVRGVSTGLERLNLSEHTIAQSFKTAGYSTALFGKWHNGSQHPYHPNARGFDEYYGFTEGHWGLYFDTELDHNGKLVRGKGYITDDLTNHAMDYMAQHRARPFFCYLALNTPHSPMQVPDRNYEKFAGKDLKLTARDPKQEDLEHTRAALAMVENIDQNVGRLLAKLDELKLENDTIVLYFSDNGPNGWRWNGEMRGRKGTTDEGGVRSPLLVRWPGKIKPGTRVPQIAGAIDLFPTLADMCGVSIKSPKALDGRSVRPLLLGENKPWPDRMIFSHWNKRVSVRTQNYRLDDAGRLYDMVADPRQDKDIAAEKPEVAAQLRAAVAQWKEEMLPSVGPDERPYPVGHAPSTLLGARDGVPHGGIKRSASAPNCSYFVAWNSTKGSMTWDIEVAQTGNYVAEIYYAVAPENLGSTVELEFQGTSVVKKITEAWNPPLLGKAQDRHDRGAESFWKDFKPYVLGTMALKKGRGLLTLRATEVVGKEVAEVRYVCFRRA